MASTVSHTRVASTVFAEVSKPGPACDGVSTVVLCRQWNIASVLLAGQQLGSETTNIDFLIVLEAESQRFSVGRAASGANLLGF